MRGLTSLLIGLFTVVIFVVLGVSMLMSQRIWIGYGALGLALFRLVVWIRQVAAYRAWRAEEDDGLEPPDVP